MTTIATQAARDLARCVTDDLGVAARYRRGGTGDGVEIRCRVTPSVARGVRPGGFGAVAGAADPTHVRLPVRVLVRAPLEGEPDLGQGTTASGGVVRLLPGDTLEVEGTAINRSDSALVKLRVGQSCRLVDGGYWTGEVSP